MRTLSNTTTKIHFGFPRTWDPSSLTDVTLGISSAAGVELAPSESVDIYAEASLENDAHRYARSVTLAEGSESLYVGDLVRIAGILGYEDHTVKGWDEDNLTVELEDHLDRDFEAGATVNRLSVIASVDLSDTDVFPPGIQMVLTWTPTGTAAPVTQMAEIEATIQMDLASFITSLKALYPRAYDALIKPADRLDTVIRLAQEELRLTLASRGLDITRIVDQRLLTPSLTALVALMWARGGDEQTADEQAVMSQAYSATLESLCLHPIWIDSDGDGIKEDDEVGMYPAVFERIW